IHAIPISTVATALLRHNKHAPCAVVADAAARRRSADARRGTNQRQNNGAKKMTDHHSLTYRSGPRSFALAGCIAPPLSIMEQQSDMDVEFTTVCALSPARGRTTAAIQD